MPKIKVLSAENAFLAAHYGGPFDFNKEDYIIVSITDIRNEEDCPVIFRPIKNLKAIFRVPFIDLAADKLEQTSPLKNKRDSIYQYFLKKKPLKSNKSVISQKNTDTTFSFIVKPAFLAHKL